MHLQCAYQVQMIQYTKRIAPIIGFFLAALAAKGQLVAAEG